MSGTFSLTRPRRAKSLVSLAPMIDVMMILLVFFMVTSIFLDLNMIPAVQQSDAATAPTQPAAKADTMLIRLGADGMPAVQGQTMQPEVFAAFLRDRLATAPDTQIVILPSGSSTMQALVTVMDLATQSGARSLRVVRLEARP